MAQDATSMRSTTLKPQKPLVTSDFDMDLDDIDSDDETMDLQDVSVGSNRSDKENEKVEERGMPSTIARESNGGNVQSNVHI